jgi:hypothetical protein
MEKLVFSLESVRTVSRNEDLQSRISQKVSGFARVVDIEASFGMLSVRPRGRAGSSMTSSQGNSHQKQPTWPKKLQWHKKIKLYQPKTTEPSQMNLTSEEASIFHRAGRHSYCRQADDDASQQQLSSRCTLKPGGLRPARPRHANWAQNSPDSSSTQRISASPSDMQGIYTT